MLNAYYTQFGKKINKFSYLLGLRAETTNLQFNQKTSQESNKKNTQTYFQLLIYHTSLVTLKILH